MSGDGFTHLDASGHARMVDVTAKAPTVREATASAKVRCAPHVVAALRSGDVPKGDVLAVARVAGIAAAKRTPDLLPLAHVIGVHGAAVDLHVVDDGVELTATVRTADRTGVEMEALTAAAVAGLAVVDMVKGMDRTVEIEHVRLEAKRGGRSGTWLRASEPGEAAPELPEHDVLVLAGGRGERLGGVDKASVVVGGRTLLDRVLDAGAAARTSVVVGPAHLARPGVLTVLEDPPLGGPVAGIDAGLDALGRQGEVPVVVLACDVPGAAVAVPRLLAGLAQHPAADAVHLVDADGRAQRLVAAYRRPALVAALDALRGAGGVHGTSVRRMAEPLTAVGLADAEGLADDADTWDAVRRLDERWGGAR